MIKIENLYFTYPNGKKILHGIDWEIEEGEFIAIMGENGGGKTTLVKHLNGLLKPTHGKVLIDGIDTKKSSVASLSKKVGLVFQNPEHQLFCETAEDEVLFSLKNFGRRWARITSTRRCWRTPSGGWTATPAPRPACISWETSTISHWSFG